MRRHYVRLLSFTSGLYIMHAVSRTLCVAFIFEVVIIRYDKVARDREIVHMTVTRA